MIKDWLQKDSFWQRLVAAFALLVYAAGLPVEIMEPDAAVYAEVSREMYITGNYLEIYLKGVDWLDKPHFPFWFTAWSFLLLGVNAVAYKLPAILFVILGALYTYRFGRRYYNRETGVVAALLLLTAQHIITSNMDVRAEPYMTGLTMMALYHAAVYMDEKKLLHLMLTGLGLAALMMTKGLFTIIPVGAALGCRFLLKRQWKEIFHWQWLLLGIITLLFMFPMLYGYYLQFDQHPEKTIFGRQGVSGLQFFFIDSQWGRFVNKGPIKGDGEPFFFIHTLLWAFLPWALLAYYGMFRKLRMMLKGDGSEEMYSFFGFAVMFLIFSASSFQLAHYLNGVFPLLAIVSAAAIGKASPLALRRMGRVQLVQTLLLPVVPVLLLYFFQDRAVKTDTLVVAFLTIFLSVLLLKKSNGLPLAKVVYFPALVVLMINYFLHRDFYPRLLAYQAESSIADYYLSNTLPADQLVCLGEEERIVSVKLNTIIPEYHLSSETAQQLPGKYVITHRDGRNWMDTMGINYTPVRTFENFEITMLNGKFLNKHTRKETLDALYLVKVKEAAR